MSSTLKNDIVTVEGIGKVFAEKLKGASIAKVGDLLDRCGTAKGRKDLAAATGIPEKNILRWTNMADLMRINGVGEEMSDLLEAAGVDTVKELRQRNAANLAKAMAAANEKTKRVNRVPAESEVARWIEQAKGLEPKVSH
ncbi:MAG: DUF4332 domain-containing protein [Alphaproteobacteria bacterium]|nr:DUF4332 domain-containing protein [Alphaproteobacteria bacterium]